jgi:predicted dehydrogenase
MSRLNRRRFLQTSSALAASAALAESLPAAQRRPPPSERIRLGVVGLAGQGVANWRPCQKEEIVALCDVDLNRAGEARKAFPKAKFYQDYRRLLDQKDVEALIISTPDHHHAFVAVPAMRSGKHVYCEKPLAHSVYEVRLMREAAAKHQVVTQMGTQIHAGENYRRVVEIIQAGTIGPVRRVHVWCNTSPHPGRRALKETPPPRGLDYNLWLGPAPYRPYHASHLHFHWRWWWDFGGGVLADMACHYMDLPHWALNLRTPTVIAATGRKTYKGDNEVPDRMRVEYEYPARGNLPPVHLTWYNTVTGPDLDGKVTYPGYTSGVLFVGDKGQLLANYGNYRLLPEKQFKGFVPPQPSIPRSVGHHREWLQAIRKGGTTTCNFDYSGALAETVLLGNVAYRCAQKLQYNARTGQANLKAAAQYIRRQYHKGWTL